MANAIAFYNAGLEALQEQILSKDNVVSNNYGELSNYYGKSIKWIRQKILKCNIKNFHSYADIMLTRMALYFKGLNLRCSAFYFIIPLGPFWRAVRL